MTTKDRQNEIIKILEANRKPISGTALSKIFNVSRQVIVTDIAVIRARNKNILSTNKGYILHTDSTTTKRTFFLKHNIVDIEKELNIIVDYGGNILDVIVDHDIYGSITCELIIKNRIDVKDFCKALSNSTDKGLSTLTNEYHYHTVEAKDEATLDAIEEELRKNKFLA